ncbi:Tfp pilus assembly protein FimT [Tahibacter aquaticus]|uniref:Type II secretion system protein H n=2 Tax=Tahibacter aquaticus TaxID=520092 RepID=A0A4R6ZA51_9GAMM|nr:Tfp pilus assembly protein FimT [Tahibacter aquaticus]
MELLATVAIVAIGVALALPWLRESLTSGNIKNLSNDLVVALNQARSEAVKRGTRVAVFSLSGSDSWNSGWQIRADAARDATFSTVIQTRSSLPQDVGIRNSTLDQRPERIVFSVDGGLFSANPDLVNAVELSVCRPDADAAKERRVIVRGSGEVSMRRNSTNESGC